MNPFVSSSIPLPRDNHETKTRIRPEKANFADFCSELCWFVHVTVLCVSGATLYTENLYHFKGSKSFSRVIFIVYLSRCYDSNDILSPRFTNIFSQTLNVLLLAYFENYTFLM